MNRQLGAAGLGCKLHVAVDAGAGFVLDMNVTPANEQDVAVAPRALDRAAGTDRGYGNDPLHRELTARGLGDGLMAEDADANLRLPGWRAITSSA